MSRTGATIDDLRSHPATGMFNFASTRWVACAAVALTWLVSVAIGSSDATAQSSRISESRQIIPTYPFAGVNNIPIVAKDERLYPYHSFDEYAFEPVDKEWTVVTLENDYIQVFVLPEVGGKVWGAIEKSTGNEFIYRNEVMKFRNISLRGPWTSGGIEFNFGVIGHTPSTATPVNYRIVSNDDGSVSCFVGTIDLPSRTEWRVEIRLPADAAFFETHATWSNPTPTNQPYYNWMTGAAPATDDLELVVPGNKYLKHSGEALSWPVDSEGRDLSMYSNNKFGGNKSYHVVGEYNDFFGGYYHDTDVGFGHLSPYSSMPGQKIWLWALSRQGGIWEDLLTDTDGQYTEFQAGRLFVQYAPGDHLNPIRQATFEPYRTDHWTELWFPVKGIGGIVDVSEHGAMNVEQDDDQLTVAINPFVSSSATINVFQDDRIVASRDLSAAPMDVVEATFAIDATKEYKVSIQSMDLNFNSGARDQLSRPFATSPESNVSIPLVDRQVAAAKELIDARYFSRAKTILESVLLEYPWNRDALLAMAEILYRGAEYKPAEELTARALQLDAIDPEANYLHGIINRAAGNRLDAREAFGWAERSMQYRSNANTQLAELSLIDGDFKAAVALAEKALDYDRYNINAHKTIAIAARMLNDVVRVDDALKSIESIDPLNLFPVAENLLAENNQVDFDPSSGRLNAEFASQEIVELAIYYANLNLEDEASRLMSVAAAEFDDALAKVWLAYLRRDSKSFGSSEMLENIQTAAKEIRPFRPETIPVLEWAVTVSDSWYFNYLLALNYWSKTRVDDAWRRLDGEDNATSPYFYVARSALQEQITGHASENDLVRALVFGRDDWRVWLEMSNHYHQADAVDKALEVSREAGMLFGDNFNIQLAYARSLIFAGNAAEAVELLGDIRILPSEHARESRTLYEWAHVSKALDELSLAKYESAVQIIQASLEWPERLGQGRPYDPDEQLQNYLLSVCYSKLGDRSKSKEYASKVTTTVGEDGSIDPVSILAYKLLSANGDAGAKEFLSNLEHSDEPASRWGKAAIESDLDTLDHIESETDDPSIRFSRQLILRAYNL